MMIDTLVDAAQKTYVLSLPLSLSSPHGAHSDESTPDSSQAIYAEFDDDFEDDELAAPIGNCTAMYNFPGMGST